MFLTVFSIILRRCIASDKLLFSFTRYCKVCDDIFSDNLFALMFHGIFQAVFLVNEGLVGYFNMP